MAGTSSAAGEVGCSVPKLQREGAWLGGGGGVDFAGHCREADTGPRAQSSRRSWNQAGGKTEQPRAPQRLCSGCLCPHKGRLRGTSDRPLRCKGSRFLAVSPSQRWGRSPVRVVFCREKEKAGTQCSGPASGLHLIRSAFIGRKR